MQKKDVARLKSGIARGRSCKGRWVLVAWMDSPPARALVLDRGDDTYTVWFPDTNEVDQLDDNYQIVWIGPKVEMPTPKFDHGFRLDQ